jgi:CubicO group peptidase (beta-lactamase class C family)
VLVAKDQTILFHHAAGLADQEEQRPNRIDTRFNLASLSKMFTAVALLQLVEQGKLALGDPVSRYLPAYPRAIAGRVTIHHLLTHTSGLGHYWSKQVGIEGYAAVRTQLRTVEDYFPLFQDEPLAFEPGKHFQYSNAGFVVLGAILERASGQEYWTYVREQVFEPAAMQQTAAFELEHPALNQAMGYTRLNRQNEREAGPRRPNVDATFIKGNPAGFAVSTVGDLFKFGRAIRSHRLLSPASTDLLLTGKVAWPLHPGVSYAYGWQNRQINGQRIVGHGGSGVGISTQFDLYLDGGFTVVILANYDPPIALRLGRLLQESLMAWHEPRPAPGN